jgi:hypothetical protein
MKEAKCIIETTVRQDRGTPLPGSVEASMNMARAVSSTAAA